jgi:flavin-dependent dehydrogenase
MEDATMTAALHSTGHLIIGGGLAGSMLGLRLASAGKEVTLLEKERGPHHKVCGEFLSREAVDYLRGAGLDPLALGAVSLSVVRLAAGRSVVDANLPFPALSLSRRILDEALLRRAEHAGCKVRRGAFVESLTANSRGWEVHLRDGERWNARTVFLANGKHDLRGHDRGNATQGDLVGFKMHWRLASQQTAALRDAMELFLFTGGYGGLSLIERDQANFCLVVKRARLRRLGGWDALFSSIVAEVPHLAQRLTGAEALWERPLAVSPIPYGYLASRSGLWCVGDQAAVIPSFTGDGMSIALHSASLAARMYLAGDSPENYHRVLRRHLGKNMWLATTLSQLMVSAAGRTLAPAALSLMPSSLRWIANATRIPAEELLHGAQATPADQESVLL